MASFQGPGGAARSAWGVERRFNEIRSTTAQAKNPPNSNTSANMPLASRCANAQNLTAANIGCLAAVLIRPGRYAAKVNGNTGNIRISATYRSQAGGEYRITGAWRARPNPKQISTKPASETSAYSPF